MATQTDLSRELAGIIDIAEDERPIQRFIERNPVLLLPRNRHVLGDVLISQFPLGADFKADFAYAFFNSTGVYVELIELESPRLAMFTGQDDFSRPYLHALQQAEDWLEWSERNQDSYFSTLEPLLRRHEPWKKITIFCRVVAGRRAQLGTIKRRRRYAAKRDALYPAIEFLTYDRLMEQAASCDDCGDAKCVKYKRQSFFEKETKKLEREQRDELRKIPGMYIPDDPDE